MRSVAVAVLASFLPLIGHAQQLTATEWSFGAAAAVARHTFAGAEVALAHRAGNDMRVAFALAGGALADQVAARAQVTVQLLVNAAARSGPGVYAGMGAACAARRGTRGQGFLVVLLGVEDAPGRPRGWYAELGFAGGVRAAAGLRLRRFPRWWEGTGSR